MADMPIEGIVLSEFAMKDYDAAIALWRQCPGIGLSPADERPDISAFLGRNPGLSFAAWSGESLVGTSLCGSDGRRGYLYHVAVEPGRRGLGIGRALVEASLAALSAAGIRKCHLFVLASNESGAGFWRAVGWFKREDISVFSRDIPG
jgi:ribosomal protein S18 acetylase RimI-like enzyme